MKVFDARCPTQLEIMRKPRSTAHGVVAFLTLLALLGCAGAIEPTIAPRDGSSSAGSGPRGGSTAGAGSAGASGDHGAAFACDGAATPPPQAMLRLTTAQHLNTLRDLIGFGLGDAAAAQKVLAATADAFALLPPDERPALPQDDHGTFRRLDQEMQQPRAEAAYAVAVAVAGAITRAPYVGMLLGPCGSDADARNDGDCITSFIRRFGGRALRRPLDDADVAFYRGLYGAPASIDAAALSDVVAALLLAPRFLYRVEHGSAALPGKPTVYALSSFERASRLSYQLWDTMPDEALWAAASSGELLSEQGYQRQIERLAQDERARPVLEAFFREWLKLENLPRLDAFKDDPGYRAFAGADLPTAGLRDALIADALAYTNQVAVVQNGSFRDVLLGDVVTAADPAVAKLYGVPAWSGGAPPNLGNGERPGLLARAALLANASPRTSPILRGVRLRRDFLCDDIPMPPAMAAAKKPEELTPELSMRQATEALTAPAGCAACHATLINPLGFSFEGFDSLGRTRSEERIFRPDGTLLARVPVDTRVTPQVEAGDVATSQRPADLVQLMLASGKAEACFARHVARFTFQRWDDPATDGCALERVGAALRDGTPVVRAMQALLTDEAFTTRPF